jgi:hypothetical protein
MKLLLAIAFVLFLAAQVISGPPEPPIPPEPPKISKLSKEQKAMLDSIKIIMEFNKKEFGKSRIMTDSAMQAFRKAMKGMKGNLPNVDSLMKSLNMLAPASSLLAQSESLTLSMIDSLGGKTKIRDILIEGDSIQLTFNDDKTITFPGKKNGPGGAGNESSVTIGKKIVVEEGQTRNGSIVNVGADVVVKGQVNGSVMTMGGDIYVASTGFIRDGAVAVSGKVKQEAGARIGSVNVALNEAGHHPFTYGEAANPYRILAIVFLVIYVIWILLSAIFTSLIKANIVRVTESIISRPWRSFFMGYLAYAIVFVAIIALTIIIIGIPLAWIGVPLLFLASMILAQTALSNIIGQKVLDKHEISLRTYLYGTAILSGLPGLLFLFQLITGSLVLMIFSWIFIGFFIFGIIPLGLGAVLATRFGTRPDTGATNVALKMAINTTPGPSHGENTGLA